MSHHSTTYNQYARRYGVHIVDIPLPGNKHTTGLAMTCRKCGFEESIINVSQSGGALMPPEIAVKKFKAKGWEVRGAKTTCPTCLTPNQRQARLRLVEPPPALPVLEALKPPSEPPMDLSFATVKQTENEEPIMAEPAHIRDIEPDKAAKRRIHAEIAGNWDERNGRYIGSASDQYIAEALKVPRAWVAEIRSDFFGEDGLNDDAVQLKAQLDVAIAEVQVYATDALNLAEKYDKVLTDLKGIRARLERVEKSLLPRR